MPWEKNGRGTEIFSHEWEGFAFRADCMCTCTSCVSVWCFTRKEHWALLLRTKINRALWCNPLKKKKTLCWEWDRTIVRTETGQTQDLEVVKHAVRGKDPIAAVADVDVQAKPKLCSLNIRISGFWPGNIVSIGLYYQVQRQNLCTKTESLRYRDKTSSLRFLVTLRMRCLPCFPLRLRSTTWGANFLFYSSEYQHHKIGFLRGLSRGP